MNRKQLAALFVCNLAPYIVGNALLLLLPVYLNRLGADSAVTGLYLATAFLSLAVSTAAAGWLADRFQRRKPLLVVAGLIAVPLAWLMSVVTSIPLLTVVTALLWFVGGIVGAMVNILAGLFSEAGERGRIFGIIGVSLPLGGFLGGSLSGAIVDRWGFPALFIFCGIVYALIPLAGMFLKDKARVVAPARQRSTPSEGMFSDRTFLLIFIASVLAYVVSSEMILIRPMIMDRLDFPATAISMTGALGSLAGIPLPFFVGWLSDRLGRRIPLMLCYAAVGIGAIILTSASAFWQFWITSVTQTTLSAGMVVGSALVTDLFSSKSLGVPLSRFAATPWIGFVIGFTGTGLALRALNIAPTLIIGSLLAAVAVGLIFSLQYRLNAGK